MPKKYFDDLGNDITNRINNLIELESSIQDIRQENSKLKKEISALKKEIKELKKKDA